MPDMLATMEPILESASNKELEMLFVSAKKLRKSNATQHLKHGKT